MTILTIEEAAVFLRVTKRTLYRLKEIPRVRIGHSIKFLHEDLEVWVRAQREGGTAPIEQQKTPTVEPKVDEAQRTTYHRNPVFRVASSRSA